MTKWSLPARSSQSGGEMDNGMKDKTYEEKARTIIVKRASVLWGQAGESLESMRGLTEVTFAGASIRGNHTACVRHVS